MELKGVIATYAIVSNKLDVSVLFGIPLCNVDNTPVIKLVRRTIVALMRGRITTEEFDGDVV